ncbi:hypothetical protein [Tortoise microvirus 76]|nr:hypothetical protein [Tortoise microvirus 76]
MATASATRTQTPSPWAWWRLVWLRSISSGRISTARPLNIGPCKMPVKTGPGLKDDAYLRALSGRGTGASGSASTGIGKGDGGGAYDDRDAPGSYMESVGGFSDKTRQAWRNQQANKATVWVDVGNGLQLANLNNYLMAVQRGVIGGPMGPGAALGATERVDRRGGPKPRSPYAVGGKAPAGRKPAGGGKPAGGVKPASGGGKPAGGKPGPMNDVGSFPLGLPDWGRGDVTVNPTQVVFNGNPVNHDKGFSDAEEATTRWGEGDSPLSPTFWYQWSVFGADMINTHGPAVSGAVNSAVNATKGAYNSYSNATVGGAVKIGTQFGDWVVGQQANVKPPSAQEPVDWGK